MTAGGMYCIVSTVYECLPFKREQFEMIWNKLTYYMKISFSYYYTVDILLSFGDSPDCIYELHHCFFQWRPIEGKAKV